MQSLVVKDAAHRASMDLGIAFEEISVLVAYLGRSSMICAYKRGKTMDLSVSNERGPFSTIRPGAVPAAEIIRMAYSGLWSRYALLENIMLSGGMSSYTGTTDLAEVSGNWLMGDAFAKLVIRSMAYQVAQEISAQATMLHGDVDAIILTGDCANDDAFTDAIKEGVSWITDKIIVYPGADKLVMMANCAFRVLSGKEKVLSFSDFIVSSR
jgi:butyrate kinase